MTENRTTDTRTPYQKRREAIARALAASMMGLRKDAAGADLPDECWLQLAPKADAILFITSDSDRAEAGRALERGLESYHGPG